MKPSKPLPFGPGDAIVLDTSTIIAYLNGDEPVSEIARAVIEGMVATHRNPGWVSSISVAEVLVRPMRLADRISLEVTKTFLLAFEGLSVRSADFLVAAEAAGIRARTGASLPDALVAATATITSSRWLVTNDLALKSRLAALEWQTKVMTLSELGA